MVKTREDKTWTRGPWTHFGLGPWTTFMDWIHGPLSWTGSMDTFFLNK